MLRSKPLPRAREVYFGISYVSHSQVDTVPKANAITEGEKSVLELSYNTTKMSSGQDIYFFTHMHEQLDLTDASLQGVAQVGMCCPSTSRVPDPQLPMKQFPKQGTNYSSPQQGEKKTCIIYPSKHTYLLLRGINFSALF